MIIDIEYRQDDLYISYFDKEGNVQFITVPLAAEQQFNWEYAESYEADKTRMSWDDKWVKKTWKKERRYSWNNPNREMFRLSKYRIEEILSEIEDVMAPAREYNRPKKYYIDIETEVTDGFPEAELAQNRVLSIAIANDQNRLYVLGLKDLSDAEQDAIERDVNEYYEKAGVFKRFNANPWQFNYVKFESEQEMLYTFFSRLVPKMPCLTGWNFIEYDWKYLVNRCANVHPAIDPAICSVAGRLQGKNKLPVHRLVVDYLEIYKKWDRTVKIKESNRLDFVAEKTIGVGKMKYNGSIKDLYEHDFYRFILYNTIDSSLIYYMDKKLNTMSTFLSLAHVGSVEVNKAFSPIWVTEALMTREFLKMGKVFVERKKDDKAQQEFQGAYVKEPIVGMHQFVTCYDFASLYPNTMMQYNISPETYRGKKPVEALQPGEIITAAGTVFDNSHDSVLRKILKDLYGKRKSTKKNYLAVAKEIDHLEHLLNK